MHPKFILPVTHHSQHSSICLGKERAIVLHLADSDILHLRHEAILFLNIDYGVFPPLLRYIFYMPFFFPGITAGA